MSSRVMDNGDVRRTMPERFDTLTEGKIRAAMLEVDRFLDDPISFGTYDYADPISLSDFIGVTMHSRFIDVLS